MFDVKLAKLALGALAAGAFPCAALGGDEATPQFRNYPSETPRLRKGASLRLTDSFARAYRTRLLGAAKLPPNFAGAYRLTQWGCGTTCLMGAVINLKSGRVFPLPFTICCSPVNGENFHPIAFRPDSRLIVFTGLRNEKGADGAHYYTFDGHRFKFLKTVAAQGEKTPPTGR